MATVSQQVSSILDQIRSLAAANPSVANKLTLGISDWQSKNAGSQTVAKANDLLAWAKGIVKSAPAPSPAPAAPVTPSVPVYTPPIVAAPAPVASTPAVNPPATAPDTTSSQVNSILNQIRDLASANPNVSSKLLAGIADWQTKNAGSLTVAKANNLLDWAKQTVSDAKAAAASTPAPAPPVVPAVTTPVVDVTAPSDDSGDSSNTQTSPVTSPAASNPSGTASADPAASGGAGSGETTTDSGSGAASLLSNPIIITGIVAACLLGGVAVIAFLPKRGK